MLQEFHERAKNDGKACHATYILSGFVEESIPGVHPTTGSESMQIDTEDFPMSSAPATTQESSLSNGAATRLVRSIIHVDEKDVQGCIALFTVNSRYEGSIQPVNFNTYIQFRPRSCRGILYIYVANCRIIFF